MAVNFALADCSTALLDGNLRESLHAACGWCGATASALATTATVRQAGLSSAGIATTAPDPAPVAGLTYDYN